MSKNTRLKIELIVEQPEDLAAVVNSHNRLARFHFIEGYTLAGVEPKRPQHRPREVRQNGHDADLAELINEAELVQ
jgi:hypothetical protein